MGYLWAKLLEDYGLHEAERLTEYVAAIRDHKGYLTITWRDIWAMAHLRPAVKYAWGVLDVRMYIMEVTIEHIYPGGCIVDGYAGAEMDFFENLGTVTMYERRWVEEDHELLGIARARPAAKGWARKPLK